MQDDNQEIMFPEVPTTNITSVEASPRKVDIYNQLVSGWSPWKVRKVLLEKYGEDVPWRDIEKFRERIAPQFFLKLSYLQERLKRIDVQVDALDEMVKLLMLARDRLDEALVIEATNKVQFDDPTKISTRSDSTTLVAQRLKVYWQMLKDYIEKLAEIGQLGPPIRDLPLKESGQVPTIREILQERRLIVERTQWEALPGQKVPPAVIEGEVRVESNSD